MPLGYYRGEDERLVSVTSFIDYTFGIADEIDKWTIKQAILAVQKASKTQKLTQETAISIGLEARSQKLDSARNRGTQVHQAIQNLHNGLPYGLNDDDRLYYEAYFNFYKHHTIEPILEEFKVTNHQYGYAGRLDFYGKLNNKLVILDFKTSKSCRWTYGLQLACYRKCLEDMGYEVDATYVVHIKPKVRGGVGTAELVEYKYPFESVKWALGLFHLKLAHDPYVKWYERTDEDAIKKEVDAMSTPVSAPSSDIPGQPQDTPDISPTFESSEDAMRWLRSPERLNQEDRQLPETIGSAWTPAADLLPIHMENKRLNQADETSSPPMVIQEGILLEGEVIRFDVVGTPRIVPDPSSLPVEIDISAHLDEVEGYELDIRQLRRRAS